MINEKVAVILLNWRNASDTIDCINSVLDSGVDIENIIVVDNDSRDDSIIRIKESFQRIKILDGEYNGGFAYGCNIGIKMALKERYEYIWLLNNDTLVNKDTLPKMIAMFHSKLDENIGIVGSCIRDMEFPHNIQTFGGGNISYLTGRTKTIGSIDELNEGIDFITGASMLVSRNVFEKIGLLDERYFMYWEDVEFCLRARRSGFTIRVATDSLVMHKESSSFKSQNVKKIVFYNASQSRFFKEYYHFWPLTLLINSLVRSIKYILLKDMKSIIFLWKRRFK